jgi:hypothetical protein
MGKSHHFRIESNVLVVNYSFFKDPSALFQTRQSSYLTTAVTSITKSSFFANTRTCFFSTQCQAPDRRYGNEPRNLVPSEHKRNTNFSKIAFFSLSAFFACPTPSFLSQVILLHHPSLGTGKRFTKYIQTGLLQRFFMTKYRNDGRETTDFLD